MGLLSILGIIGLTASIAYWINRNQENKEESSSMNINNETDANSLMFSTLRDLGCQPTKNDDGSLSVAYQGENFHIEFSGMCMRIWNLSWAKIDANDPELPNVREAMNLANFYYSPTILMTVPNTEGEIFFHSRSDIVLHPSSPYNIPCVKGALESFFDSKRQLYNCFQELNEQQADRKKNRRPIGFVTNQEAKNNN